MTAEPKVIDVEETSDLVRLVDEVRESQEPRLLRRRGEAVAVITPIGERRAQRRGGRTGRSDFDGFRSAFGGWAHSIDVDAFLDEVYADRERGNRPPVDL